MNGIVDDAVIMACLPAGHCLLATVHNIKIQQPIVLICVDSHTVLLHCMPVLTAILHCNKYSCGMQNIDESGNTAPMVPTKTTLKQQIKQKLKFVRTGLKRHFISGLETRD